MQKLKTKICVNLQMTVMYVKLHNICSVIHTQSLTRICTQFDVCSAFVARASKKKGQLASPAAKPVKKSSSAKVSNTGTFTQNVKKDAQKENTIPNSSSTGTSNGHFQSAAKSSTLKTEVMCVTVCVFVYVATVPTSLHLG